MARNLLPLAVLVPTLAASSGCFFEELVDGLNERSGVVDVYTTSQSTPDHEGNMPARNGKQLVFKNDMGWDVFVNVGYVTTSGVTLQGCDGESFDVEMYWGALAEDMTSTADADTAGVGGVRALSGTYCDLRVVYGPAEDADADVALGTTVYLSGSAVKGDSHVDFVWSSAIEVDTTIDISDLESGEPFTISREQYVSKKLTVSKAYNRFFDGVDFSQALSQADIDDLLADSLRNGTTAVEGSIY